MDALASASVQEAQMPWPSRRSANYALTILIIAFAFSFLDRVILSMLMVPIQQELHFTDIQLALLHGFAFAVFYALAGLPLGRLADTISRKRLIAAGILIWSMCTAACGLARGFASLFLCRVGVGIGEAALSPAAFSMLSDYFPPAQRGRAIATYQLGVVGGAGLAYMLGGLVIAFVSSGQAFVLPILGELSAWRMTFLLVGLPGVAVALLALTMGEPPRRETAQRLLPKKGVLWSWLGQNALTIWYFSMGFAAINISFNAIIAWGPTWLTRVYQLDAAMIGLVLGLAMLFAGGIGQIAGAWRSDRLLARGHRTAVFDTGAICALVLIPLSVATVIPILGIAVPLAGAVLFFSCAAIGHAPSLIGQIAPNAIRGQVAAVFLLVMNIVGAGVGPFAVAVLTETIFADPSMVGVSIALTAASGAAMGAMLLWAGKGALRRSADSLAEAVKE